MSRPLYQRPPALTSDVPRRYRLLPKKCHARRQMTPLLRSLPSGAKFGENRTMHEPLIDSRLRFAKEGDDSMHIVAFWNNKGG
jgi:hypothetical protein